MGMKIIKKERPIPVPTSSMGDIAFLLIIFFMLTSKFMQESHVQYQMPASPDVKTIADVPVSVIVDENADIWLQGKIASPEEIKTTLNDLRGENKHFTVMLKVHRDLQSAKYNEVIRKLAEAGVFVAFVGDPADSYQE